PRSPTASSTESRRDGFELQPRAADHELVAVQELLLALDAHEHAGARSEVRQHDRSRLFLDEAVLIVDERIRGEDEVTDRRPDLHRLAARDDARALRAAREDLHDPERRRPLRRRIEVRRTFARSVVRLRVALDREQLIADDELVADLELDWLADAQEHAVAV